MSTLTILQTILIYAIPILFAITVHEVAHGWVANRLGDPTARMLGRLTLNPIKHIDIVGTLIVPATLYFTTGFIFGWAKPVPIGWRNLRFPRRDVALVASAGPLSNLIMALLWGVVLKLGKLLDTNFPLDENFSQFFVYPLIDMCGVGIQINLILMVLNLIPLPPLDGSRVLASLLPPKTATLYARLEPFGFLILILLLVFQVLIPFIAPMVRTLSGFILILFGLNL